MKKRLVSILLIAALMLPIILNSPVMAKPKSAESSESNSLPIVEWIGEDTTTKGAWVGVYGSCGHILPGAPKALQEIPINEFSVPIGGYDDLVDPPYNWADFQIPGIPYHRLNPPYYDEFIPLLPDFSYSIFGTRIFPGEPPYIQYPAFEWAWSDWYSTRPDDERAAYYEILNGGGPGWRLATWDDGGERCSPTHGYINVTLTFPAGTYNFSLYAYDYERWARNSQEYRIYDGTGAVLLAQKQISGTAFDEGIYETFRITAPYGGTTIIVQVWNDIGHEPVVVIPGEWPPDYDYTNNVVLSGIFVDCVGCWSGGHTPGFWKNFIPKNTGIATDLLLSISGKYPALDWIPTTWEDAVNLLDYRYPDGKKAANDDEIKAQAQTLALLLAAEAFGNLNTIIEIDGVSNTVLDWIEIIEEEFNKASPDYEYIKDISDFLNNFNT